MGQPLWSPKISPYANFRYSIPENGLVRTAFLSHTLAVVVAVVVVVVVVVVVAVVASKQFVLENVRSVLKACVTAPGVSKTPNYTKVDRPEERSGGGTDRVCYVGDTRVFPTSIAHEVWSFEIGAEGAPAACVCNTRV